MANQMEKARKNKMETEFKVSFLKKLEYLLIACKEHMAAPARKEQETTAIPTYGYPQDETLF